MKLRGKKEMSKAKEFLHNVEERITTNKESVFEVLNIAKDIEEITKELKFQANQAKRDPDQAAEQMLNRVIAEFFKLERIIKKAKKDLGI